MKSPAKFFVFQHFLALLLLFAAFEVSGQNDDRMSLKLAQTAIEKYSDYEQAEKYLMQISNESPYRDSTEFLMLDGKMNAGIADRAKTAKPGNYKKSIEAYEKLYSITGDSTVLNVLADLKYKYDKSIQREKTENEISKQNEINAAKIDSAGGDSARQITPPPVRHLANFPDGVFHNPTWHIGLNLGFSYDYFNYAALANTHFETTVANSITDSATTAVSKFEKLHGIGLKFGLSCHPYISDIVAVGVHADGEVGTTHLIFAGGGNSERGASAGFSKNTSYFYANFNYGLEVSAGWYWIKFVGAYDHSLRHTDLTFTEDSYSYSNNLAGIRQFTQMNGSYKLKMEIRHEEIICGLRLFPYSKDKLHIKNPCILDLAYTLNRDYNFGWKGGTWNYNGINDFYHGFKIKLWVESILGLSVNVSFPNKYFKANNELINNQANKTLPFIGVSLFYNKDFFGKKY